MERVDRGCEAGPSLVRPDAGDVAAHSLLRASTSNSLSTRFTRGSPISTAFAPELAVDPAVPVAALVKIEPLGDEALQGFPLDPCVGFPLVEGKLRP